MFWHGERFISSSSTIIPLTILFSLLLMSTVNGLDDSTHLKCSPESSNCFQTSGSLQEEANGSKLPVLHIQLSSFDEAAALLGRLNGSYEAWITSEEGRMSLKSNDASNTTVSHSDTCQGGGEEQQTPGWVKRLWDFFCVPLESNSVAFRCVLSWTHRLALRLIVYEKLWNFSQQSFELLEIFVFTALDTSSSRRNTFAYFHLNLKYLILSVKTKASI